MKVALAAAALALAAIAAFGVSYVAAVQHPGPALRTTADVATGSGDRHLLNRLAAHPRFGYHVRRDPAGERVTLDTALGADALELFRMLDAEGFLALDHESPVVRLTAAHHLIRKKKGKLTLLRALLADGAAVDVGMYDDVTKSQSVREVTIALLCAHADDKRVRRFLERSGRDWTLLAARGAVADCLDGYRDERLPLKISRHLPVVGWP